MLVGLHFQREDRKLNHKQVSKVTLHFVWGHIKKVALVDQGDCFKVLWCAVSSLCHLRLACLELGKITSVSGFIFFDATAQKQKSMIENWTTNRSAVVWRKVILVIFVIFELGPDSESLCNALPSESISCGIRVFFHPKNCLWSFGPKKWEKS